MLLLRFKKTNKYCLGLLFDDKGGKYYTLENAETLIPKGDYTVEVNRSPGFKRDLPLIYNDNVPASRGIRIHSGNTAANSMGCILIGNGCNLKGAISDSAAALNQLLKAGGKVLRIADLVVSA